MGPARILIIDDEAAIRESLEALLSMEGFHVTMAADGPAGLEQLTANAYDLSCSILLCPARAASICCRAFWRCSPTCRSS